MLVARTVEVVEAGTKVERPAEVEVAASSTGQTVV